MLASTLSFRAVGPATVLSHNCGIPSLLKDDQIARHNRLPVQCRHLASQRHRAAIPVATQMSLPLVCLPLFIGRREKTPTPKTRFSIWTLLRTPGRFTTRPLPVYFTTKMSVVRPFSVLSKDEMALCKTGRFLSKAEILGVGVSSPLPSLNVSNFAAERTKSARRP